MSLPFLPEVQTVVILKRLSLNPQYRRKNNEVLTYSLRFRAICTDSSNCNVNLRNSYFYLVSQADIIRLSSCVPPPRMYVFLMK